tara:strand:- start:2728 stop:3360 length:633 start_codon:yes stop_codon:yes gene_type:complete
MGKKNFIQLFLFILLILITFIILSVFYKSDKIVKSSMKIEINKPEETKSEDNKNLIQDIRYTSNNDNGDIIEILADYGEPSTEISDLMFLTKVEANINLKNKSDIKLTSDYANFNSKTFETTFINNVKIFRNDETIFGNELYLVFDQTEEKLKNDKNIDQNLIRIKHDVIIKKPGYMLKADVLEIDLITKNTKIYMNNQNDKVQATSKLE